MPARYYPAFLDLGGRKCVVVGGGGVAERKAADLIRAGALLSVVSPTLTARLGRALARGDFRHVARAFRNSDLRGAALVVAATDDPAVNRRVAAAARKLGVLINVADDPARSNFIVPATLRRGPLSISVSTSGASPHAARVIKRDIEERYGPDVGRLLTKISKQRRAIINGEDDPAERVRMLRGLLTIQELRRLARKP